MTMKYRGKRPQYLFLFFVILTLGWLLVQLQVAKVQKRVNESSFLPKATYIKGATKKSPDSLEREEVIRRSPPLSLDPTESSAIQEPLSLLSLRQNVADSGKSLPKVAYVISVTKCEPIIIDAASVLAESIRVTHDKDHHSYTLIAILHHTRGRGCGKGLDYLGYQVTYKDLPFRLQELQSRRDIVQGLGCCGIDEYLKLYAYTFTEYDVVIHLDVDVVVLQPLNPLIDAVMHEGGTTKLRTIPKSYRIPRKVDLLYTREYNTHNKRDPTNRLKNGVQGAFFVLQPNMTRYEDLLHVLKTTPFDMLEKGWNRSGFGGYWGSAQIQGLFSYYYYLHPETIVELDHCRYNTLGTDLRYLEDSNQTCRTGEMECEDCSTTPLEEIYLGHLSSCLKPWWCQHAIWRKTPVCRALTQQWFEFRRSVQDKYQLPQPPHNLTARTEVEKRFIKKTFGFCQGENKEKYVLLQLPPNVSVPTLN